MKVSLCLLLSVFAVWLSGCGPTASKCTTTAECSSGRQCIMGECRATQLTGGSSGSQGGGSNVGGGANSQGGGDVGGGTANGGGVVDPDAGLMEEDAGINPNYDGGCGPINLGNPSIRRRCATATANECDGTIDTALTNGGVPAALLNGAMGNGFDDDCDGLVDEGCPCPGNGITKDCYLVPASQTSAVTNLPVGWCANNAKGSLDCSGGELATWSGTCRGAQPPATSDSCSTGDFNCDGVDRNSALTGCSCAEPITCPTSDIVLAPYPNPQTIQLLNGSAWITDTTKRAMTTNWTWTILGGDCDNVLPHPTFAIYDRTDSTAANARKGTRTPVRLDTTGNTAKYVSDPTSKLIGIQAANYGNGVSGGQIYPAFGLSGDYIVQGEFSLGGTRYSCTQKVAVRAPGIRAELCWDSVGGNDVDLHFARLQGITCGTHGWDRTCTSGNSTQDCYYSSGSGCASQSPNPPGWGYANSANTACFGWASKRATNGQPCTNPRLDRDNVGCNTGQTDPTGGDFCGPENINIDNPNGNDSFVVGVNYYQGNTVAKPHVNLYCNGTRVISVGYNPATGQTGYPRLLDQGADSSGDFWTVGTIKANVVGGQLTSCDVVTIPSRHADAMRDGPAAGGGGNNICVDSTNSSSPYTTHKFIETAGQGGSVNANPTAPGQYCKH